MHTLDLQKAFKNAARRRKRQNRKVVLLWTYMKVLTAALAVAVPVAVYYLTR